MTQISSPSIVLIDNFCAGVLASRRKIVFWDTCSLLDIIRFPRDNNYNNLASLIRIHHEIMSGNVYSVASEITIKEFNDHESQTITEVRELIRKNSIQYHLAIELSNHFTSANLGYVHIDTTAYNLDIYLTNIVDDILSKTFFIQKDEIAPIWLDRIVNRKTPLKRKGEYKDAAIWSTCISIADKIDASNHHENVVFFSSNKNDYYEAGTTFFSLDIQTECSSYNIKFTINFDETSSGL